MAPAVSDSTRPRVIIEATLRVIIEHGVHHTTHRLIAEAAEVPLGSVTYYFASLEILRREAFRSLMESMSAQLESALSSAHDRESCIGILADLIFDSDYVGAESMTALYEMYSLASHDPAVHDLSRTWLLRVRAQLEQHFDPVTSASIDAFVEGWAIHRSFTRKTFSRAEVIMVLRRVAALDT